MKSISIIIFFLLVILLDHPFGTIPSPYKGGLPANFPDYCEVY